MPRAHRSERRRNSLSLDAIVGEAVAILDELGERGLTVRRLAERLNTGSGAIYWYVDDMHDLVNLACDRVMGDTLDHATQFAEKPLAALRALALAVFDELDRHPWAGPHVSSTPDQRNTLLVLDRIGQFLEAAGLPSDRQFFAATAVMNYVVGIGTRMARSAAAVPVNVHRTEFLAAAAERWEQLDETEFAFVRRAAPQMRDHDDREQFTAGLDLLLAGIAQVDRP